MTQPDNDLSYCVICGEEAQFTDNDPGANPVSYCSRHLPAHLHDRASAGQLPLHIDATVRELQAEAKTRGIEGYTSMNKTQLQTAVAAARATEVSQREERERPDPRERAKDDNRPVRLSPEAAGLEVPEVHDHQPFDAGDDALAEPTSMSDAPDDFVAELNELAAEAPAEEQQEEPKKSTRKGSSKK